MHDELLLGLIGRGISRDDLHEELKIGFRCGLTGFFNPGEPGDLEAILRDMERRGLLERDGWEWRRCAATEAARLF